MSAARPLFPREQTFVSTHGIKTGHEQMQQRAVRGRQSYSITSSARARGTEGGFIPEFGDVKKAIRAEQERLVTLATRWADMMKHDHSATLN